MDLCKIGQAGNLPVSKVRQILHLKTFTQNLLRPHKNSGEGNLFFRFKNELWSMDPAFVEKLAKDKKDVYISLARQDLFNWTVDAK